MACRQLAIFTRMKNLAKKRLWQEVANGLPNDMAKNGLLVIRDFYQDSKFWQKITNLGRIRERFEQNFK